MTLSITVSDDVGFEPTVISLSNAAIELTFQPGQITDEEDHDFSRVEDING